MRVLLALSTLVIAGCAPQPVDVDVGFPSLSTFLFSDFGRLLVYEVEPDEEGLGSCAGLLVRAGDGNFGTPVLDSDWRPICDFRARTVAFDSIPPGPHAYVAIARDEANVILLSGCTIAEAYEGAPPVDLELYPTDVDGGATNGRSLTCSSEMDKCTRGCR